MDIRQHTASGTRYHTGEPVLQPCAPHIGVLLVTHNVEILHFFLGFLEEVQRGRASAHEDDFDFALRPVRLLAYFVAMLVCLWRGVTVVIVRHCVAVGGGAIAISLRRGGGMTAVRVDGHGSSCFFAFKLRTV
jgi:hypothetical protein